MVLNSPGWILDLLPEAICHIDTQQRYLYANQAYQNLVKKPLSSILGITILENLGEELYQRLLPKIQQALNGKPVLFNAQLEFSSEDLRDVEIKYLPQFDESNQVTSFVVLCKDITEKAREEKLRIESEQVQETYFNIPNLLYCIAGKDGFFKKLNPSWEAITGHSVEELLAHPFIHFVHPDDQERTIYEASAISRGAKSLHFKNRYRCKNGSYKWIEWNSAPRGDFIYAIARDITEVYLAELAVKESEERFRQWFEAIPQIVWTTDSNGAANYFNSRWYEYTGMQFNGYKAEDFDSLIHPDDLKNVHDIWSTSVSQELAFEVSFRMKRTDGEYRWHLGRSIPIRNQANQLSQWIGTATDIHDQKELERTALEWKQRTEAIVSSTDMVLWSADEDGIVNFSQGKTLSDSETNADKQLGINIFRFHRKDTSKITAFLKAYAGQTVNQEVKIRGAHFSICLNPLKDVAGKVVGIVGVSLDISQMRKAEEIAKSSEERFKAVVEQSPIATALFTWDGKPTKINRAFQDLWGLSDEVVTDFYLDHYNILADPLLKQLGLEPYIQLAFQGNRVLAPAVYYDPAIVNQPGHGKWVESHFSSVKDKDGKISEVILVFNDITARKKSEDVAKAQRQELQSIIDHSPAVIYVNDLEGRALIVNSEYEKVLEKTKEEVVGKSAFDFFPKNIAEKYREHDLKVIENVQPVKYEEEVTSKAGQKRNYFSIKFPIKDNAGKVIAVGGISTDVTFEKKLEDERYASKVREEAAHQASNLKSTFLANMSHEIRTPLGGVIGMSDFLLDSDLTDKQRYYAQTLKLTAEGLLTVINDILDFSKIESGKLDLENIDFNLDTLIQSSIESFRFAVSKKNIDLQLNSVVDSQKWYKGDPHRIRQVLLNLLSNAIKFTDQGSVKLDVTWESTPMNQNRIRFQVLDTGIGMTKETIEKLFQPFTQEDSSIARRYGGSGLGLVISKNLCAMMGGEIGVESEIGKGTVFWFTVPLSTGIAPHLIDRLEKDPLDTSRFEGLKVLAVEDNPVNQLIVERTLANFGMISTTVGNGKEAVEKLKAELFDLVLMDCQMPEMDGYTATQIIRSDPSIKDRNVPIIAMTANAMNGDKERCLSSGMNDYISKPTKKIELINVLTRVLFQSN